MLEKEIERKQAKELIKKLTDFEWRLTHLYYIATEEGETILFKPNEIQRRIIQERSARRDIVLKYRQGGVSTLFIILMIDEVLFGGSNVNNVFVTHRQDLLGEFFKKARFIFDMIPEYVRGLLPEPSTDNANEIAFKKTRSGKILNNSLKISLDVRGRTPTSLHISEYAFMDIEKQKSLKQQIDQFRRTKITIETTANGIGDTFYKMCMNAKLGKGTYKLNFYPWYIDERNKAELPYDFCLTEEEMNLKSNYNLNDEQIYWRRLKIEDANALGFNGLEKFHEENPITIESAFISSGSAVFDLTANYKIVRPIKEYEGWKVYREPEDNLIYRVDIAEGGNTGDFSAITRYNRNGQLVLTYKGRVNEEMLAKKMDLILNYTENGKGYLGWIVPENNIGRAFINECKKYKWFYLIHSEIKPDFSINDTREPNKYGFRTTKQSKDYIIRLFRGAIHNQTVEVSEEIKSEIDTFIYDQNNRPNAISPNHDDLLISAMISFFRLTKIYGEVIRETKREKGNRDKAEDIAKDDFLRLKYGENDSFKENIYDDFYYKEQIL